MLTGPSIKARSGNPPKRLVILFHGIGTNGHNLIDIAGVLNRFIPDTNFIAPNAPHPYDSSLNESEFQWFSRQDRSEAAITNGLKTVEPIVSKFIDYQLQKFGLTEKDLAVIGFSQGTMVALHCLLRRPKPAALVVGFSGALLLPKLLDTELKSKPPILLIHGEADKVLPIKYMHDTKKELASRGIEAETHSYPHLAHAIGQEGFELAVDRLKAAFEI